MPASSFHRPVERLNGVRRALSGFDRAENYPTVSFGMPFIILARFVICYVLYRQKRYAHSSCVR